MAVLERLGARELRRAARRPRAPRHRLRLRADRRAASRCSSRYQVAWLEEEAELLRALRPRRRGARRRRRCAPRSHSPTYRGGIWDRTGAGLARPRQARRRACATRRCAARRARLRAHAAPRRSSDAGDGVEVAAPRRPRPRAPRRCSRRAPIPPLLRAIRRYVVPVYDYVLVTEPLERRAARRDRLAAPPGHRRRRQPVPLLPADRRRPDPVGRLRRRLPLRRPGRPAPRRRRRRPSRTLVAALLPHVPAARGPALHPPLGRRDRHLQPLLGVLRHRARRPRRLRRRLHRPRRRRDPLRRARRARPARRPRDRGDAPALRAHAGRCPFPPEPLRCGGRPAHPQPARRRRPQRRAAAACGCGRSTALGLGFDS